MRSDRETPSGSLGVTGRLPCVLAVVKGFEPLEGLHPHTFSRSVINSPHKVGTMRELGERAPPVARDRARTLTNETRTETTDFWSRIKIMIRGHPALFPKGQIAVSVCVGMIKSRCS
jgi:hypothetical protein